MDLYNFRFEKDVDSLINKMKRKVPFFGGFSLIGRPEKMMGNFSVLTMKNHRGKVIKITGLHFDMNRLYEKLL